MIDSNERNAMPPTDPAIRVPEAARRSGLTIRDLYLRIDAGELAARRDEKGMVVIPVSALVDLGSI